MYFCKVNKHKISYKDTKLFSKLIIDFLDENKKLDPFISDFPSLKNSKKLIDFKKKYVKINRFILVDALKNQNSSISLSEKSKQNIAKGIPKPKINRLRRAAFTTLRIN